MQFYDCNITFDTSKEGTIIEIMKFQPKKMWGEALFQSLNEILLELSVPLSISIYNAKIGEFKMLIGNDSLKRLTIADLTKILKNFFSDGKNVLKDLKVTSLREITPLQAGMCLKTAERDDYFTYKSNWNHGNLQRHNDFSLDYYQYDAFKIEEFLFDETSLNFEQAMRKAKTLMADKTFTEELERIYSAENSKNFYGHPVHYKFLAKNAKGAKQMAELLCQALYENKRLIGRCISFISDIREQFYGKSPMDSIFDQSEGNTIIIELRGSYEEHRNYATCYERVVKELAELVRKYQHKTLFIFLEVTENPGFSTKLISSLQEDIYMVEIKEGAGNKEEALQYFEELMDQKNNLKLRRFDANEIEQYMGGKVIFYPSDVHQIYDSMLNDSLRNTTYAAYKKVSRLMISKDELNDKDAYKKLQDMIGLKEIKKIISQIIGNAKIQKIRSSIGLEQQQTSMHMVFTGNPGSAKTTVARLLAEIMNKEGILRTGEFIECGRADLVGEYVGQTAPKVKNHFRLATGGILFIDEAYSLVEHWDGSYGDEAISTIVQEMENRRNNVIVIFAGYPDKMKNFLSKNEGLRSRIAFHVDFPNYNADELLQILQLMAKNKGFELNTEIEDKCREIFSKVCNKEDFGNGRFVRNLLEQALMKQSQRIIIENDGKEIGREELLKLKVEDFEVNVVSQYSDNKGCIGFKNHSEGI